MLHLRLEACTGDKSPASRSLPTNHLPPAAIQIQHCQQYPVS